MSLNITDTEGKETKIALGYQEWETSPINFYPPNARKSTLGSFGNVPLPFLVSGAYAWVSHDKLEVQLYFVNWMSAVNLTFYLHNDKMDVNIRRNFDTSSISTIKGVYNDAK